MKKLNKVLSVGLSLALCLSLLPVSVFAAEASAAGSDPHLTCTQSEHQHNDGCYKQVACTLGHTHGSGCAVTYKDEEHSHTDDCYSSVTCDKEEHTHNASCRPCPYGYTHQCSVSCIRNGCPYNGVQCWAAN